jgi:hypothetical protein
MKMIRLRTKMEIILIVSLLLAIGVSATVTINNNGLTTTDSDLTIDFGDNSIDANNITAGNATVSNTLVLTPTTTPANPSPGMIYVNSANNKFYFYNGNTWIEGVTIVSAGTAVGVYNGSWIAHGLPGNPHGNGSITLSLRGSTQYNATRF